jgi:hypothetical protein
VISIMMKEPSAGVVVRTIAGCDHARLPLQRLRRRAAAHIHRHRRQRDEEQTSKLTFLRVILPDEGKQQ